MRKDNNQHTDVCKPAKDGPAVVSPPGAIKHNSIQHHKQKGIKP